MANRYIEENQDYLTKNIDDFKLLIITATPLEKEILHQTLKPIEGKESLIKISKGKQTYYFGIFGMYKAIHVACGDMGSIGRESSIITTSNAISDCNPKIVLMVGIAFGVNKKKQKIGDILVSERVIPYEPQRVGKSDTVFRGKEGPASSLLLNRFRNVDDWEYPIKTKNAEIIIGEILSGEKLIDNPDLKDILINKYPNAKGGEMEGAGVYAACDGHDNHWILVKGICDYADGNKNRNKEANQIIAAKSAINLCEHVFNLKHSFENINVFSFDSVKNFEIVNLLNKQVARQLKKQINSCKYLQNTFIETGEQKDNLRYLTDSVFYSNKCFEEISIMDFRLLNKYLTKENQSEFNLDFKKFQLKVEEMTVSNSLETISELHTHAVNKKEEIINIQISSNEKSKFEYKFRDRIEDLAFLKARVALITENAGQGKTNFLCDFSENFLLKRQIPTLFLTGTEINAADLRFSILQKVFPNSIENTFEEFLEKLKLLCYKQKKFFVLIIDGINENINAKLLSHTLETFIAEILEYDFIKVVISCRTEYYQQNFLNLEKSSFSQDIKKISTLLSHRPDDDVKEKLFDIYFHHFNISHHSITDKAYNQLVDNFLLLRIFCEAYKNQNLAFIDNIYKEELFEKYYSLKSEEINKRLIENDEFKIQGTFDIKNFISSVVKFMIESKTYVNVPLDKIIEDPKDRDMYIRFLDENILVKRDIQTDNKGLFTNSEVVNFTFDEFRDFMISRYLVEVTYPESPKTFIEFIESEITEKSPLLEGCSTFLFFISRRVTDSSLNVIIASQSWFERVFSKSIFSLKDSHVTEADKLKLKEYLKSDLVFNDSIIFNLIRRYNIEHYKILNIDLLFDLLRELNEELYNKCFISKFENSKWGQYSKISQGNLIDQLNDILVKKEFIETSPYHKLFELLIYMFTNQENWKIQSLYEKYYFKHSEIGKIQLRKALESNNDNLIGELNLFIEEYEISL